MVKLNTAVENIQIVETRMKWWDVRSKLFSQESEEGETREGLGLDKKVVIRKGKVGV